MPPPIDHPALHLHLLPRLFEVVKLEPDEPVPAEHVQALIDPAAAKGSFISVTRTDEEISIVRQSDEPDAKWRCIKIAGPMEFDLTGVVCNFTAPLKHAGIGVFAVSTWNTDYVLVPKEFAAKAVEALKQDGWTF
ncbi:hypothetical protein PHLGIDRAFT_56853, partial [Phlebiopsis gigantea 11061_1 CR5-6]